MATRWLHTIMLQSVPFDGGKDARDRRVAQFNFVAVKVDSATFLREAVRVLADAGIGLVAEDTGRSIFWSSAATMPAGPGPLALLISTGGLSPIGTHNTAVPGISRPSAQVSIHAAEWDTAEAKAKEAWNALAGVVNTDVEPVAA